MTFALVDCRIQMKAELALCAYADKVIKLPPHPLLAAPVASHPDMLLWICEAELAVLDGYGELAKNELSELRNAGFEMTETPEAPSVAYPHDVLLNCATVGNKIIANTKAMSSLVAGLAQRYGKQVIHTPQGYAKCSTAVVSDNAIITADRSIHTAAEKNGISSLLISAGGISLDGYDYGFIGGASAATDSEMLFFGDLASHIDGERIYDFCIQHGKHPISLTNDRLYDYGTGIIIS